MFFFSSCPFPFGFTPFLQMNACERFPLLGKLWVLISISQINVVFLFRDILIKGPGVYFVCVSALKCRSLLFRFWFVICDMYNLSFDPSPLNCAPVSPVGNDAPCGRDFRQIHLAIMEDRYHPDQPNSKSLRVFFVHRRVIFNPSFCVYRTTVSMYLNSS